MYIVIGSNGFLGSYVAKSLLENSDERIIATYRISPFEYSDERIKEIQCDVTDISDIKKLRDKVDDIDNCKIFYFAACHNLDYVKRNPDEAKKINIDALINFLKVFREADKLFFSSTDCVYGENTDKFTSFKESDPVFPVSEYGHQKLQAEVIVTSYGFNVVRLPFMLGPSLLKQKKHFYDNIIEKSQLGEKITLADGLWRSALDYKSVADILVKLSKKDSVPPILNLCGDDALSKYDIGVLLEKKYGLPHENIVKVSEAEIRKFFFEERTSSTIMDNSLLKSTLGIKEIKIKI